MAEMINGLTNDALFISLANSAQTANDSAEELTDEQKKKIAKIESDLAARLITKGEAEREIAAVKSTGIRRKKKPQVTVSENNISQKNALAAVEADKAKAEQLKNLKELLRNKNNGLSVDSDVNKYIDKLKNANDKGQSVLLDKTA